LCVRGSEDRRIGYWEIGDRGNCKWGREVKKETNEEERQKRKPKKSKQKK